MVSAVPHSRFGIRSKVSNLLKIKTLAEEAIRVVGEEAGVREVMADGNRFEIVRVDGSSFHVQVVAADLGGANMAEVTREGGKTVITISTRVKVDAIQRTMIDAVAQAREITRNAPTGRNLLDGASHPGDGTTLSAADHGRQAEVRHLDSAKQELSRRNVLRRRRIANEMQALVEHLGLHPDDEVAPQRQAVSDPEVNDIVRSHVDGQKRPAWALPPDGYPKWKSFLLLHLPAEVLPGSAAGLAIYMTGGPGVIGAGVAVGAIATGVTGTITNRWYGRNEKSNVDSGHGYHIEVRKHEAAERRQELLDPLLSRTRISDNSDPGPDEPAVTTEKPPTHQSFVARFLFRGVPSIAGATAASSLYFAGLPAWSVATHAAVAFVTATLGPKAEKIFRKSLVPREWGKLDAVGREQDEIAAAFDETFAAQLSALADRIDNLAGLPPVGATPATTPVKPAKINPTGVHRYGVNQFSGQSGDIARGGIDALGKWKGGNTQAGNPYINTAIDSLLTGSTRAVLGTAINSLLDKWFTDNEYKAIIEQVYHDFGNEMVDQTTLEHTILTKVLDHITAKVDEAEQATNRVNARLAADLTALRSQTPNPLIHRDNGERPLGHQRLRRFAILHGAQAATMEGLMAGATWAFHQPTTGMVVIGAVAGGIVASFPLRYLFRHHGQLAVDETILRDRAMAKPVEEAEAEARLRYWTERFAREIEAARTGQTPPAPPRPPAKPDPQSPKFIKQINKAVAHEREMQFHKPRPLSLLGARLVGLDRVAALAKRVRLFEKAGATRAARQAREELANLWEAYENLRDNHVAMPTNHELLANQKPEGVRGGHPGTRPAGELQSYMDNSVATSHGRAYYAQGDPLLQDVHDVPQDPDKYTIDMHGGPDFVRIGNDRLTPADLATLIRADPNWHGEPIRLLACQTGQNADGFAQQLADELGVTVYAPSDYVELTPDGELIVSAAEVGPDGILRTLKPPTGQMHAFEPTVTSDAEPNTPPASPAPPAFPYPSPVRQGYWWPDRRDVDFGEVHDVAPADDLGELTLMRDGPTVYTSAERLWPDELADIVADNGDWRGGPTRLQVRGGNVDPEFVQRLADLLGVPVVVPASAVAGELPTLSSGTLEVYNEPPATTPPPGCRIYEPRSVAAQKGTS